MFGIWTRPRPKYRRAPRPSVRLYLERLETRECPSTLSLSVAYGTQRNVTLSGQLTNAPNVGGQTIRIWGVASGTAVTDASGNYSVTLTASGLGQVSAATADMHSNTAHVMLTDTAPTISNFVATESSGDIWTFSGHVSYSHRMQGLTVTFGGQVASLQGQTTTVNASGYFTFTIQLNGTMGDNGMATAVIDDSWGMLSNTAMANVYQ
jgi:hypothetical protein